MPKSQSRHLLFGGTFDPVHLGHLLVARAAAEAIGCDRIYLLPCAQSPHKQGVTLGSTSPNAPPALATPAEHRLGMLHAAVDGDPFFGILTIELERPPPSYSYDTAKALFRAGWPEINWLIGADQLMSLPRWHRAAELVQQVKFIIAARPGWQIDFDSLPENFRDLRHNVVTTPEFDISSTDIRRRVREERSIHGLVPDAVATYITQHRLYVG